MATTSKKTAPAKPTKPRSLETALRYLLIVVGIIGILASVAITIEKFDLIQHPNAHFICDLNPVISCGSVMESKQSHAFGFMNTYIGIVGFPILLTTGVAMLAGARFKKWYWQGMLAGLALGMLFAYWLLFESIYRIRALCPYCLSVDVVLTAAFWYTLLYNLEQGYLGTLRKLQSVTAFLRRHHLDILLLWYVVVIILILNHFWYYYGQHLHL